LSVVGTVLLSSVLVAIIPSGKTSDLIKAILRTACIVVILSPATKLFVELKNNSSIFVESSIETHNDFIEYSCTRRVEETEKLLMEELSEEFDGIHSVTFSWALAEVNQGRYLVEEIQVNEILVETKFAFSSQKIEEVKAFLLKKYGCESSVQLNDV
jgi:hypothetical protein